MPDVMVSPPAMPRTLLADNCKDVPLRMVLYKLAVPLRVAVPVKVTVPADAVKLPATVRLDDMEKSTAVLMDPVTDNIPKLLVPAPDMVLEAPLRTMVPAVEVKLPLTVKFPVIFTDAAVLTVPLAVKLSRAIPEPLMVVPVPIELVRFPIMVSGVAGNVFTAAPEALLS